MNGIVARVFEEKKFGFIQGEDGIEYFFHRGSFDGHFEDLILDIRNGRKIYVSFDKVPSDRGPRAGDVKRLDTNPL